MRRSFALLLIAACKGGEPCPVPKITSDEPCTTSQDCRELLGLSCVDGLCRRPCTRDSECLLQITPNDLCRMIPEQPLSICEDQICIEGCTSITECGDGERCLAGRCTYYREGFEPRQEGELVTLDRLSFDLIDKELENPLNRVVSDRSARCIEVGDCPGAASEGEMFAVLATVETPFRGVPEVGLTCRACSCCLDCLADPPITEILVPDCPRSPPAALLSCPASIPPTCQTVCSACEQCPTADRISGDGLFSCEQSAAERTCSSCVGCEQGDCLDCRAELCPADCFYPSTTTCRACEARNCPACADCRTCYLCSEGPSPECDQLGYEGCFAAPIAYPRQQLTDLEQSLVSPDIDLSAAIGPLSLRFDHVAFDVGDRYRPGIQGTPPDQWPERDQEVVVSLCASRCELEESWIEAELVRGGRASFPDASAKRNGLSIGEQAAIDWRIGRIAVAIPDAFFTAEFRFRFLPRLDRSSIVGIDDIRIQR